MTSPSLKSAIDLKKTVPGGFSVKNLQQLQEGGSENFQDLLKNTPGVYTQSNSSGEASKVSIRGSGIQSEDEAIGIQFLLDGFPFNQGDGEVSLDDFDLNSLQYAEVYRGANAFKYGSYTLGGAIN
ncbi:MAG: Plug domain-containing protein, partial [Chitinivibrionales bacterium]